MSKRKKLVAVVGPTGSGKTALGIELAKNYNGIIISADSRQVYSGLDAGTNKEGTKTQWQNFPARSCEGIFQLMTDVANPGDRYTVADWLSTTKGLLEEIWSHNLTPIIVGGTGLYVSALLEGYVLGGGRHSHQRESVDFDSLVITPMAEREELYQRSNQRCQRVFDSVVAEVKQLMDNGVSEDWLVKIGLDYRFATRFILHHCSRDEAITECQGASRAYIRRQLTWWRHHQNPISVGQDAVKVVEEFLKEPKNSVE